MMSKNAIRRAALLAQDDLPESTRLMLEAIGKMERFCDGVRGELVEDLKRCSPSPSDLPSPPEERGERLTGTLDGQRLYSRKPKTAKKRGPMIL